MVLLRGWGSLAAAHLALAGQPGTGDWPARCRPALMAGMPPHYIAYKVADADMKVDGRLDEEAWRLAPKVADFASIYGPAFQERHPEERPWHSTEAQILWSDEYVYVSGRLAESQLWAIDHGWTLPEQQVSPEHPRFDCSEPWIPSCPYRSADFEFFFSPALHGSTEWYKEFEFNANVEERWNRGQGPSVMTLALPRPYHDLHGAIPLWLNADVCPELQDFRYAVAADGRINDPEWAAAHPNGSWTVEARIPVAYLVKNATGAERPADGVQWRQGFSRVEYHLHPDASAAQKYRKVFATAVEREQGHLDRNFVWPPTYMYDMHMPDLWAVLQFSALPPGGPAARFDEGRVNWPAYGTLSRLYYAQWDQKVVSGRFSTDLAELARAYRRLADPTATDAYKSERQIFMFPPVQEAAWDPACADVRLEEDSTTGWRATVRTPERPGEVWSIDGWRRIHVAHAGATVML